jgi:hypothetical protein
MIFDGVADFFKQESVCLDEYGDAGVPIPDGLHLTKHRQLKTR